MKPLDQKFLKRIYELSALVSLWAASFLLIGKLSSQGFSLLFGSGLGILLLMLMEWTVKKLTDPTHKVENKTSVLTWIFLKYPALGVLFYFLVRWESFNLAFFAAGLTLPYFIIFLKGIGMVKTERTVADA